jgi:predicted AlkP superfamily pyrophosphatase or phosphodiesterase
MSTSWTVGLATVLMIGGCFDLHRVVVDGAPVSGPNKLLVMLIDGFRWDYFDQFNPTELPGFNKLRQNGVSAGGITPAFPSLSIVNYYSLMTGKQSWLNV